MSVFIIIRTVLSCTINPLKRQRVAKTPFERVLVFNGNLGFEKPSEGFLDSSEGFVKTLRGFLKFCSESFYTTLKQWIGQL